MRKLLLLESGQLSLNPYYNCNFRTTIINSAAVFPLNKISFLKSFYGVKFHSDTFMRDFFKLSFKTRERLTTCLRIVKRQDGNKQNSSHCCHLSLFPCFCKYRSTSNENSCPSQKNRGPCWTEFPSPPSMKPTTAHFSYCH